MGFYSSILHAGKDSSCMTTVLLLARTMMLRSCCFSWVSWYHSLITSESCVGIRVTYRGGEKGIFKGQREMPEVKTERGIGWSPRRRGQRKKFFLKKKMQMKFSTGILQESQPSCKNKSLLLVFFFIEGRGWKLDSKSPGDLSVHSSKLHCWFFNAVCSVKKCLD